MRAKIERQDHPSRRRWQPAEIALLGKVPDAHIARKLKISPGTVAGERRRLGIPPLFAPFEWTEKALSLLGSDSDARIAGLLGVSPGVVGRKRRALEIPACFPPRSSGHRREDHFWTAGRDALLGTASDAVIARRLRIRHHRVRDRRYELGIPPACPVPRHDWTDIDPLLGREADAAIAARFGMHQDTVRLRRLKLKIPPCHAEHRMVRRNRTLRRLIERPTAEITEVSSSAVVELRRELGVPSPPRRSRWTPSALRRLGRDDDEAIARDLGLSPHTVRLKRCSLGKRKRVARPWTEEERALLAAITDDEQAARRLGRTLRAIQHQRARSRTPAQLQPGGPRRNRGRGKGRGPTPPRRNRG